LCSSKHGPSAVAENEVEDEDEDDDEDDDDDDDEDAEFAAVSAVVLT
jgi:hypothetical protein